MVVLRGIEASRLRWEGIAATDRLARPIASARLAIVPGAITDAVTEQPDWIARVPRNFLA
jgi:hypothetical protein